MNSPLTTTRRVAVIGRGRLGNALALALARAGVAVEGPLGHGAVPGSAVVLLCVPDAEIATVAAALPAGRIVGHCSGASGLEPLAPHEAFSLHPLMTVTEDAQSGAARLRGAAAAVDATSERARRAAHELAGLAGLRPIELDHADDRVAYHAAASIASNFLVTLVGAAEHLAATAGVDRAALVPLVRAAVENWAALGPERALTGPLARGDEETVAQQRAVIEQRTPELLGLFDQLCADTRVLAGAPAR